MIEKYGQNSFFAVDHSIPGQPPRIKLQEKFGFVQEGRFVEHYLKNGKYEDIVRLVKFGATWVDEQEKFKSRVFGKIGVDKSC